MYEYEREKETERETEIEETQRDSEERGQRGQRENVYGGQPESQGWGGQQARPLKQERSQVERTVPAQQPQEPG